MLAAAAKSQGRRANYPFWRANAPPRLVNVRRSNRSAGIDPPAGSRSRISELARMANEERTGKTISPQHRRYSPDTLGRSPRLDGDAPRFVAACIHARPRRNLMKLMRMLAIAALL